GPVPVPHGRRARGRAGVRAAAARPGPRRRLSRAARGARARQPGRGRRGSARIGPRGGDARPRADRADPAPAPARPGADRLRAGDGAAVPPGGRPRGPGPLAWAPHSLRCCLRVSLSRGLRLPTRGLMYSKGLAPLAAATAVTITTAFTLVFFYAPNDADQGFIQKIFY